MGVRTAHFLALILTALALVPAGAHLFALINKIGLPQDRYFIVQGIYRGWSLLGTILIAALVANLAVALLTRQQRLTFWLAIGATAGLTVALAVFFIWTYPANRATANWTVAPTDWAALRQRWEYSHAASAALIFSALCCTSLSAVIGRP